MDFIAHTPDEKREMLHAVGLQQEDELFRSIPEELKHPTIPFPKAMTELEITQRMEALSQENIESGMVSFLGGGAYQHFIPQAEKALISRGDFYTAYTPYQAEASQGTLTSIYEFQTLICRLTGMEVANASMYDGSTALAEAALMACRVTRKEKVAVSSAVNPHYRRVMKTFLKYADIEVIEIPHQDGFTDANALGQTIDDSFAGVFVQYPNYFGIVEPMQKLSQSLQDKKALFGVVAYPHALGVLQPPGKFHADIVIGDLQSLGIPLSFGGPYAGFIACKQKYLRQIPGRLVGRTKDADGNTGFVLTLQTREQHIRRAKATSNICTNQALCALASTIYLFLMGSKGLRQVAEKSLRNAHHLKDLLCQIDGVRLVFDQPFFNEFVIELPIPIKPFIDKAKTDGVHPGIRIDAGVAGEKEALLVCATELTRPADMNRYADILTHSI